MRLDDLIDALQAHSLFRSVEVEALRLLAFSATRRSVRGGDVLFRKGEAGDGAYLVLTGEVTLDAADNGAPSGKVVGPGALIGQSALFASIERPITALCRGNGSVLFLSRDLMTKVLEAHPASASAIANALSHQAKGLADQLSRLRMV